MTLHQALRVIDHTLTPETTKFSDYVLETSDDNLFLRTLLESGEMGHSESGENGQF